MMNCIRGSVIPASIQRVRLPLCKLGMGTPVHLRPLAFPVSNAGVAQLSASFPGGISHVMLNSICYSADQDGCVQGRLPCADLPGCPYSQESQLLLLCHSFHLACYAGDTYCAEHACFSKELYLRLQGCCSAGPLGCVLMLHAAQHRCS